jgi:diguanylate cyclase (GGDEF)-like protein
MDRINQADELYTQRKYSQALALYLNELDQLEQLTDSNEITSIPEKYILAAKCCFFLQDQPQGIELARKALISAKTQKNLQQLGEANLTLGILYGDVNAWELSIEHSRNAYTELKDHWPIRAASALNNIGNVYEAMLHYDKALEYFESAILIYDHLDTKDLNLGIILGNAGKLKAELGNHQDGLRLLRNSAKMFQELNALPYQAHSLAKIAHVFDLQHEESKAVELYHRALTLLESEPHHLWRIEILNSLSKLLIHMNSLKEAENILSLLYESVDKENLSKNLGVYYENQSLYFEKQGNWQEALHYYKKLHTTNNELQKQQGSTNIAKALALLDLERVKLEKDFYRQKNKALEEQIIRDPLTGLYNRRFLMDHMPTEFARMHRSKEPFGFVFADVDSFKQINDTHSHLVGDKVLIELAGIFEHTLRNSDLIIRYGGDEFIICMPGVQESVVSTIQEKLQAAVLSFNWAKLSQDLKVSVSFGIVLNTNISNLDELLHLADQRMYLDKRSR